MKSLFAVVNALCGILSLLIGADLFFAPSLTVAKVSAAVLALLIGAVCVWLAEQTLTAGEMRLL